MLTDYIKAALRRAHYEILPDDGVYANAGPLEECRDLLEEWLLLRVSKNLSLPIVDSIELAPNRPGRLPARRPLGPPASSRLRPVPGTR